jgi:hypothetical protein
MFSHQQSCNEQKANDQAAVQVMISSEDDLLTMPPERVNATLVAFNEGRTLEEAQRLASEFLEVLGYVRAAFIYSATMADDGRLSDSNVMQNVLSDESVQIHISPAALDQALVTSV